MHILFSIAYCIFLADTINCFPLVFHIAVSLCPPLLAKHSLTLCLTAIALVYAMFVFNNRVRGIFVKVAFKFENVLKITF
ncbi:hypothetical protein HK27_06455 [Acetobacter orientalis]|nr:hypothetical protein HK27_06455 [Acetobacter orientalis]